MTTADQLLPTFEPSEADLVAAALAQPLADKMLPKLWMWWVWQ
jgi:hypothetical protein